MAPSRAARMWPVLLGALVVVVVGSNLALVWLSSSDPSFAVEQDYYDKALHWDDKRAQDARNAALGWKLEFEVGPIHHGGPTTTLVAHVADRTGHAVEHAAVHLEAFHNARAAHVLRADLSADAGGTLHGELPIRRPGLWEFRFDVVRGADRFTWTEQRDVGVQ